jgi:predicted phosphoribosyltransferase
MRLFADRRQAGALLAQRLHGQAGNAVVLALPRGGVPVAFELARALSLALDVLLVRKLGLPGNTEYAIGAIGSGGACILHHEVIDALKLPQVVVAAITAREQQELERRAALYRNGCPALPLHDREVILIDDGMATGASMQAAAMVARAERVCRLTIAVPVAPAETCELLRSQADELICLHMPEPFYSVGQWYEDFAQTSDQEVIALLELARRRQMPGGGIAHAADA